MKPTKAKSPADAVVDAKPNMDANKDGPTEPVQSSPMVPLLFYVFLPMLLLILYGVFAN